jgi:hypothetical protein
MPRIFISYRRNDSAYIAAVLNDKLQQRFGSDSVFFDIDNIPLGVDFRKYIGHAVGQCDVLLVIIGDHWLGQVDARGHRRLDDPLDYVRIEIESALQRDIPVIPVLVGEAAMPSANDIPSSLRDLVFRNAAEIRAGRDLHQHIDRLIRSLETICGLNLSRDNVLAEKLPTHDHNSHDSDLPVALNEIQELLGGYADSRLYLAPNIPPRKLKNAISKYAPQVTPEDVLLLYDNTILGSAADGLCLTLSGVYWYNTWGTPGQISYMDIQKVEAQDALIGTNIVINEQKVFVYRSDNNKKLAASVVNVIRSLTNKSSRRAKARG